MKLHKILHTLLILLLVASNAIAQEYLKPLNSNASLQGAANSKQGLQQKKVKITGSMDLPFFDDFSYAYKSPFPTENNWTDSSAYVNLGFGIAPITQGVATFDGLNKNGYPYNLNASVNISGFADYLTSRPINLDSIIIGSSSYYYQPSDSIFITFYYQAQGFGEAPEANDSLCLDFFKPLKDSTGRWTKVWGRAGYNPPTSDTLFYRVRVGITDTAYFHDGFKFRFRNKATLSGSLDHWNIDYVQIKRNYFYDDTLLNDVSFAYKPSSFLKNYSTIPFRQYTASERGLGFHNFFRNNYNIPIFSNYSYNIKDENNMPVPTDVYGTFDNPGMLPFSTNGYYNGVAANPVFTLQPFSNINTFTDSTSYTIQHILSSGDSHRENDTISYSQKFSNYYAYDDGSAEAAYYLYSYGAKTAVRFTLNVADTLKSVRIYFDPVTENGAIQSSTFRLAVWDASGSTPGNLRYKDSLMNPGYLSGAYNLFKTYNLSSCLPLSAGTYFIGIIQTTNQPLNIGFDRNNNHSNALYYNVSGSWSQSNIPGGGSLMINPVMGCTYPPPVGIKEYKKETFAMYPNPAQNSITINVSGNQLKEYTAQITNAIGQVVLTESFVSNSQINVDALPSGVYFVKVVGDNLNVSTQKLLISK